MRDKALDLLGAGINAETVSSALGVSPSYISQLLSEEEFAAEVTRRKILNLQAATNRDKEYDDLEDELVEKLKNSIPMMVRPMEILKSIQIINAAKRRGQTGIAPTSDLNKIVQLSLPVSILNQFSVVINENKQVIKAGSQDLITMQASTLLNKAKELKETGVTNGTGIGAKVRRAE